MPTSRRSNPIVDFLVQFAVHTVALLVFLMGLYLTFFHASFLPLGVAFALVGMLEGVWLYRTPRR